MDKDVFIEENDISITINGEVLDLEKLNKITDEDDTVKIINKDINEIKEEKKPIKIPGVLYSKAKVKRKAEVPVPYDVPDFSGYGEQDRINIRLDYNLKLKKLEKLLNLTIKVDDNISLEELYITYKRYKDYVAINNTTSKWKNIITICLLVMEKFLTWMGLDASGFAENQLKCMNDYEAILVEMGEQTFFSIGSDWPPMVKLILMILGNSILFICVKMVSSNFLPGSENMMMDSIRGIISQNNEVNENEQDNMLLNIFKMFNGKKDNFNGGKKNPKYKE